MKKNDKHITLTVPSPLERARVRLKICGMKYENNIEQVAALQPDYLGFIFYDKSERHFKAEKIPNLPEAIKKTGVFVNADLEFIVEKIKTYNFQAVQLHGEESPEYCLNLQSHFESLSKEVMALKDADGFNLEKSTGNVKKLEIIKVFSIKDDFNFDVLKPFEDVCDYFLFDTKGKLPGGNGYTFNWDVLNNYPSTKPYFLSGGIGVEEIESVLAFLNTEKSKYCYAIDVNSKFEMEPGLKNSASLKVFKDRVIEK